MNTLIWLAVSLHLWGCLLVVCRHSDFVDGDWIESHCYHLAWERSDLTQPFSSSWDGEGGGPGSWVSCCPQTGSVRRRPVSSCLASSEAATSSRWTVSPWSTNLNMDAFHLPRSVRAVKQRQNCRTFACWPQDSPRGKSQSLWPKVGPCDTGLFQAGSRFILWSSIHTWPLSDPPLTFLQKHSAYLWVRKYAYCSFFLFLHTITLVTRDLCVSLPQLDSPWWERLSLLTSRV